jgi:hypothetical protein
VQILAGNTPTPTDVASGPAGELYQAIAGTSMSAPHITGSAALVLALHPGLTPAEVKSALMMTANRNVVEADGSTPATPFDDGAGRVDLNGVVSPGLVMNVSQSEMDGVLTDAIHRIDLNEPSVYDASLPGTVTTTRTFENIDSKSEAYSVHVTSDLPGGITVSPSSFVVKPGKTATVSVTLNGVDGTAGHWYFGQIDLTQSNGSHRLHLPVAFKPSDASTTPLVTLTSSCDPLTIPVGAETSCTATAQNNAFEPATVKATMTSTNNLKIVGKGRVGTFGPVTLHAASPPIPNTAPGSSPFGFFDLATFGITLNPIGDEQLDNWNVPGFVYDGQTYSRLAVDSNGYLVVGGGDGNDNLSTPPGIPNPARPNNVLAPFWSDLDAGNGSISGEGYRVGILSASATGPSWIVVQYDGHVFGHPETHESFQVWIGINGTQDISYTYRTANDPNGLPLQVGAENADGSAGNNVPGVPSGDLVVSSTPGAPGGSATFTAPFRGTLAGPGTVETDMTSDITRDTSVSRANVTVTP